MGPPEIAQMNREHVQGGDNVLTVEGIWSWDCK